MARTRCGARASPWEIVEEGERWYGRGTADNKGQHSINLAALGEVLRTRGGRLGFNTTVLLEMGEESGSPASPPSARRVRRICAPMC
ncbi:M20/M25/M40 family metallo-hydrolase [Pseudoroseomonas wenyumeiae]